VSCELSVVSREAESIAPEIPGSFHSETWNLELRTPDSELGTPDSELRTRNSRLLMTQSITQAVPCDEITIRRSSIRLALNFQKSIQ
jgi:hypothetical protein